MELHPINGRNFHITGVISIIGYTKNSWQHKAKDRINHCFLASYEILDYVPCLLDIINNNIVNIIIGIYTKKYIFNNIFMRQQFVKY
jgi:hypothetical protein